MMNANNRFLARWSRLKRAAMTHERKITHQGFRSILDAFEPSDPKCCFAGALRLLPVEIVESAAGMGVDHRERRGFARQMIQDGHQRDVLDHIGEIAGMKGVAVIHARMMNKVTIHVILNRPLRLAGDGPQI